MASGSFDALTALRGEVLVDELTASLIRDRFELSSSEGGSGARARSSVCTVQAQSWTRASACWANRHLRRSRARAAAVRERVSRNLRGAGARAVVVVGTAGTGKSRLRHEFLRRIKTQGPMLILRAAAWRCRRARRMG